MFSNDGKLNLPLKSRYDFFLGLSKTKRTHNKERQTKNIIFQDNPHFHLISNKYWKIEKHWKYWIDVQRKNGINARDKNSNPSSAFDVKGITSKNTKGILNYLTKYVTKNESEFRFLPWNCSKTISELYTSYYSDFSIIKQL
jgi:hypothetical protein